MVHERILVALFLQCFSSQQGIEHIDNTGSIG